MAPTIEQLEIHFETTVETDDLLVSMWSSFHEVRDADLTVENGRLEKFLGLPKSPAVKLRTLTINGPEAKEWVAAKSGSKASENFTGIVKAADRSDPWAPKK